MNTFFGSVCSVVLLIAQIVRGLNAVQMIMSSHEMWRHTLVILSNVECARIGWSDVQTPPPPLKVKLKFRGGGGGGLVPDTPPHHHP